MPIQLTDKFGLDVKTSPDAFSAFAKYLQSPDAIVAILKNPADITKAQISQDPLSSASVGLNFKEPVNLGSTGVQLTINPSLLGTIAIAKDKPLFDPATDPFGDSLPIPANQAFVSLGVQATLALGLADTINDLQFGFTNESQITITNYRLFPLTDQIVPAIQTLFQTFIIPGDIPDIEALTTGSVATVTGKGSLKFTAEADLPASVNPLATVTQSLLGGMLQANAGGTLTLKAVYTFTGEYQIRIQRLAGRKFELGYMKKRSSELDVTVEAQAGVTAGAGGFDLIKTILQIASSDPVPDQDTLQKQVGLTDDQISSIAAAVKAGIERSVQLSLKGELDLLDQTAAAFSFQVDLDAVDASGAKAINQALDGDLTGLQAGHAGVKPLRNVFSHLLQKKGVVNLNLLGIFNFSSVTTLLQNGTVIVDPDTGNITLTDKTTASRIGFASNNFAKNGAKLRKILADSVMVTAAYRGSGMVPTAQFSTSQWFFELHQSTNLQNVKHYLNIVQALQAISQAGVDGKLSSVSNATSFGQSLFSVNASYDDNAFRSLFIAAGKAREQEEYESIGKAALLALMPQGNSLTEARRIPLTDAALWSQMKDKGQPNNFGGVLNDLQLNANQLADITSDYTLIMWWAEAMSGMAAALEDILDYLAKKPHPDPEDNSIKQLRAALNKAAAAVGQTTESEFGEPFGLLALDSAASHKESLAVQMACSKLSFATSRT
jgi:hypothetical protein